jgi:hypothetical protein
MFRNWLNGSRDLYYAESFNKGGSFTDARKLGEGTWKLNGCPMDGGGITIDNKDKVHTVWQRNGVVYYCEPGQKETELAKGRNCGITRSDKSFIITWQEGNTVKLMDLANNKPVEVGQGSFIKAADLPGQSVVCTWENNKEVVYRKM